MKYKITPLSIIEPSIVEESTPMSAIRKLLLGKEHDRLPENDPNVLRFKVENLDNGKISEVAIFDIKTCYFGKQPFRRHR